jgi:hypothetical protein
MTWSRPVLADVVEQREATVDFVHFDHALKHVLGGDVLALAGQVVCNGKNGSEIVKCH